jgi:DNA-directed RNA polymerase subunit RPC12/RpoP
VAETVEDSVKTEPAPEPEDASEEQAQPVEPETKTAEEPRDDPQAEREPEEQDEPLAVETTDPGESVEEEPAVASILLRGPKGSTGIETSLTDADGNVACPGCGRRKPSPGPGRYSCSSCNTEFVIPRVLAKCPGCGRERPSPGPGVYQCSECSSTFRIPPMISCPGCGRSKPSPGTGRLRCSACGTVFEVINEAGAVR